MTAFISVDFQRYYIQLVSLILYQHEMFLEHMLKRITFLRFWKSVIYYSHQDKVNDIQYKTFKWNSEFSHYTSIMLYCTCRLLCIWYSISSLWFSIGNTEQLWSCLWRRGL